MPAAALCLAADGAPDLPPKLGQPSIGVYTAEARWLFVTVNQPVDAYWAVLITLESFLRHVPGGTPAYRLKARLKAAWDS
jgi:hypothetical protein